MSQLIHSLLKKDFVAFRKEAVERIQETIDRRMVELKQEVATRYDSTIKESEDVSELSQSTLHSYQTKSMADSQTRMQNKTASQQIGDKKLVKRRIGRVTARLKAGAPNEETEE